MNDELCPVEVKFRMTPPLEMEHYTVPAEPIAFLMDIPARKDCIMSYMHVGQHGEATREYFEECSVATPDEYKELKDELESLGYVLEIQD